MACALVVTLSLFFKGRNVNPEGLVRAHWAVNPSLALQGVSASVRQVGTRLRTHSAQLLSAHRLHVRHLCGITQQDFWFFHTTSPRAWLTDENTVGLLMWRRFHSNHQSRSAEGTWVNFMVRLSYHLALSVLFSCGNLVPALSGQRLPWTPRGKSRGLDQGIWGGSWSFVNDCWWRHSSMSTLMVHRTQRKA